MRLALRLVSPSTSACAREFDERGGIIGRGGDCDWVLACPDKLISRRHAVVTFEQGRFWLYDASANGVFHNGSVEPIGTGWRVPVEEGDEFRMGEFLIQASLQEAGPAVAEPAGVGAAAPAVPAPQPPVPVAAPLPLPLAPRPTPPSAPASLPAFGVDEAFRPPTVTIPEDWDLELDLPGPALAPAVEVSRRLSAVDASASQALWEALAPEIDAPPAELTPEVVRVLGRCLRAAVEGLLALQAEYAAVETRVAGNVSDAAAPAEGAEAPDAAGFCRQLLEDPYAEERVEELVQLMAALRGRHAGMAQAFASSVETIIEQFAPEKFDKRWARHKAAEAARAPVARVKDKLVKNAGFHGFYHAWHQEQRANGYRAVHQLFEKKFLSLYLHPPKPPAAPTEEQRQAAPEVAETQLAKGT